MSTIYQYIYIQLIIVGIYLDDDICKIDVIYSFILYRNKKIIQNLIDFLSKASFTC